MPKFCGHGYRACSILFYASYPIRYFSHFHAALSSNTCLLSINLIHFVDIMPFNTALLLLAFIAGSQRDFDFDHHARTALYIFGVAHIVTAW